MPVPDISKTMPSDIASGRFTIWLLQLAIAICLALQLVSIFYHEINWDEFFYLSHIYAYEAGTMSRALQTFHIYLFFWLPWTGGNEINQVETGRVVMWLFELATCASIYFICRRLFDARAALVAVLAYVSCSFVLEHGASFRADPLAASLAMIALAVLLLSSLRFWQLLVAGGALALALLITVKTAIYAPAILAVMLARVLTATESRPLLLRLCGFGLIVVTAFAAGYAGHLLALPAADNVGSQKMLASAASNTLFSSTVFPRWARFFETVVASPINWALISAGGLLALAGIFGKNQRRLALVLALASPLLSLLFFRNAFPYYYVFIMPPAMALVALAAQMLDRKRGLIIMATLAMLAMAIVHWNTRSLQTQESQAAVIAAVHRIFPTPVAVIDRNAMIASFPKRGPFMSTWGLRVYEKRQIPFVDDALAQDVVPLLVVNGPTLEDAVGVPVTSILFHQLLPTDSAALRQNYISWWGPIWVAGKRAALNQGCTTIVIKIPGTYTLLSEAPVRTGKQSYRSGDTIMLDRRSHALCSDYRQKVELHWGKNLYRPSGQPPAKPVYQGFIRQ